MLNGTLIAERRLALGLSTPHVARSLGVSPPVISRLERGESTLELNLRQLARLGDVLGLPVRSLFADETAGQPATEDDVKLEAALALIGKKLSSAEIARGLNWSLDRTHAALKSLRTRLAGTGRRLQRSGGKYAIRPAIDLLSASEQQRLERAVVSNAALSVTTATVLHRVMRGGIDRGWIADASDTNGVALSNLFRLGWVEQLDDRVTLSDEVAFGLDLPTCRQARSRTPAEAGA